VIGIRRKPATASVRAANLAESHDRLPLKPAPQMAELQYVNQSKNRGFGMRGLDDF
jgi:hypothetical protein